MCGSRRAVAHLSHAQEFLPKGGWFIERFELAGEVEEGRILTCQAIPTSRAVVVDYDR